MVGMGISCSFQLAAALQPGGAAFIGRSFVVPAEEMAHGRRRVAPMGTYPIAAGSRQGAGDYNACRVPIGPAMRERDNTAQVRRTSVRRTYWSLTLVR